METTVTFETHRGIQYAVVQKGYAKRIVTREQGLAILEGRETVTFAQDLLPQRKTKTRSTTRRTNPAVSLLKTARLALGLSEDDPSVILCICAGRNTACTECHGMGVLVR